MDSKKSSANGEAKAAERVRVIRPVVRVIEIPIKGFLDVPLVMNKFSEKAMQMMADKQQKKGQGPREAKDPVACFRGAMHLMPGARAADDHPDVGFPAGGFRKSMIAAANAKTNGVSKNLASGAVFVLGEDKTGLVRVHYDEVRMREDAVRNDSGVADLRYRPEFLGWSATLHIQYDAGLISAEQVVNLAHRAGYSVGIGEGRPEKKGEWGRWEVLTAEDDDAPEPAPDPAAKADRPRRKREAVPA